MEKSQELKSLKRGLRALIALSQHRTMTISAAARALGLPRTTAERVMATLESERFVSRDPHSKRYALAPRVLALAGGFSAEDRLVEIAAPKLFDLTREIGWPLAIAVANAEQMSVRLTTDPATSMGLHRRHVGSEIAMAGSSSGIAHLAFIEPAEREQTIMLLARSNDPAQALARERDQLETYLEAARRDGFTVGPDLGRERAVSVPLRERGRMRAVLLMIYIARAVSHRELLTHFVPRLKQLAAEIEAAAFG